MSKTEHTSNKKGPPCFSDRNLVRHSRPMTMNNYTQAYLIERCQQLAKRKGKFSFGDWLEKLAEFDQDNPEVLESLI